MIEFIEAQSTPEQVVICLEPSTPPDEKKADLAAIIAIPFEDRIYNEAARTWTIRNPKRYSERIPALAAALYLLARQSTPALKTPPRPDVPPEQLEPFCKKPETK